MRDDSEPGGIGQLGQLVAPSLAVDDDPLEAAEQPPPEVVLCGGAAREQVVRGEDERRTLAKQPVVELRRCEPLDMGDVGAAPAQAGKPERMLDELDRNAEAGAAKESRAHGIEELAAPVAVRLGRLAEAERGGDELHLRARPDERRGELVVVLRRERGRVGEENAHGGRLD